MPPDKQENKQICNIKIMFTAETDEEAIALKKAVEAAIVNAKAPRFEFTLTPLPSLPKGFTDGLQLGRV